MFGILPAIVAVATFLLISPLAANTNSTGQSGAGFVEGVVVVPDDVKVKEPFSFSVTQNAANTKLTIRSADGIVVQQSSTDKFGRVFLAAGLPAGTYLISRAGQPPVGKIEIAPRPANVLIPPLGPPSQPPQILNPPQVLKLSDPFSLGGLGFNPNFADNRITLKGAGEGQAIPVLAATEDQLKLAPIQHIRPGSAELRVTNTATHQSAAPVRLLVYDMQGRLERTKLTSGADQTRLVVSTQPVTVRFAVRAQVASGPVDFGDGRREATVTTSNGIAIFPVHAERGSGPFRLTWSLANPPFASTLAQAAPTHVPATPGTTTAEPLPTPTQQPLSAPTATPAACRCQADGGGVEGLAADVKSVWQSSSIPIPKPPATREMPGIYRGTVTITFTLPAARAWSIGKGAPINITRLTTVRVLSSRNYTLRILRWNRKEGKYVPADSRGETQKCPCPGEVKFDGDSESYNAEIYMHENYSWGRATEVNVPLRIEVDDTIEPCHFHRGEVRRVWAHFYEYNDHWFLDAVHERTADVPGVDYQR